MEWCESNGVRWLRAELDGAGAAFSTRLGGVSEPPFDSLNLGLLTDDAAEAVAENRRRLATALGIDPKQVVFARQVHGTRLIEHSKPPSSPFVRPGMTKGELGRVAEADGQVLREPGIGALVFTADCLPVAVAGPKGMAMLHAGWRGLAGGILGAGAEAVEATSATIGPGIGPCCYEVGEEVLESFSDLDEGVADGRMLDLPEVARRLLVRAGVERVESAGLCTSCEEELFFSHRRDQGRTGRQAGVGWVEAR
ncbi:MAG: purine-nucleoside/S-methyl-5-thioadenosine phosphorylase / adenosine deaminase [Solirubrobacterales bacterium]|jgi:YfiH family protein|nr:purine-nucleoside/S-methyl-5-thioadenosine phosphorylase / adenosine deaminase [Solirubrobacterales bacterium]